MPIDVPAAEAFLAGHARLLDRRRLALRLGKGEPASVLAALDAYRNPDGGYGWGLEPDLRSTGSQPIHALHAFEVFAESATPTARAVELCDWLATVSFDDGGLPFVLPIADPAACASWFTDADAGTSSLHGTAAVVGAAWRAARHDPAVAAHPWLTRATRYCLDAVARSERLHAHETMFTLRLLDAVLDTVDGAAALLARVAAGLPASGAIPVEGGVEGEALHPLDYSPAPHGPTRRNVAPEVVDRDLARVESGQRDDGGWDVDFASFSPVAALEWRGDATVRAIGLLLDNGRLTVPD